MPNRLEVVKANYEFQAVRIPELKTLPEGIYYREFSQLIKQSRRMAIACLLKDADRQAFLKNLEQAGYFRLELLQHIQDKESFEKYGYTSYPYGFWDAAASGNISLAKQVADLSTRPFCKDFEYPEDYYYVKFVMSLFQHGFNPNQESSSLLDLFYSAAEETATLEYSLCHALYSKNETLFKESFLGFLEAIEEQQIIWNESNTDLLGQATEGVVSIESLTWLFLAGRFGIVMPEKYRFAPDLGRLS